MPRTEYPVQVKIRFTESALKEGSEEEKELHKNVKRVMEVIVGLGWTLRAGNEKTTGSMIF